MNVIFITVILKRFALLSFLTDNFYYQLTTNGQLGSGNKDNLEQLGSFIVYTTA